MALTRPLGGLAKPTVGKAAVRPRASRRGFALGQSFGSALEALGANKLRSGLTMLGITIGVAAVIVMIALGQGAKASVQARLAQLGTNLVTVFPGSGNQGGIRVGGGSLPTLTEADAKAILAGVSGVVDVSPQIGGGDQVVFQGQNWSTRWTGVYPGYLAMLNYTISAGSAFTDQDEASNATVAVVGQTIVDNLYGGQSPLGQTIRIRNVPFTVIGVLTSKGSNGFQDQDDVVLIPYSAARARLSRQTWVNAVFIQVDDASQIQQVIDDATALLRERHKLRTPVNDFQVRNNNEIQQTVNAATTTLTLLLAGVAAVSLLVGGIGIMNIMLVSVIERTREIGIRMAVGARRAVIMSQFLVEAVTLSLVGGFVGVLIGMAASAILTKLAGWVTQVDPASILLAFGVSAGVGILFGFYPARSAARLDPIVALRYE
jgi:putative ABC transport system permease protein